MPRVSHKSKLARSFVVSMGQAYYESLPKALKAQGGRVWNVDRQATEVHVRVSFASPRSAESVQDIVWEQWPMTSVCVTVSK